MRSANPLPFVVHRYLLLATKLDLSLSTRFGELHVHLLKWNPQITKGTYFNFSSRSENLFRSFWYIFCLVAWLPRCFGTLRKFRANEIVVKFPSHLPEIRYASRMIIRMSCRS